jgi:putative ABC transport system permease protein
MMLFASFALVSLGLALLGVYGVLSYRVRLRHQEIGIRMALGSGTKQIMHWVMTQGMKLAIAGLILGLGASLLLMNLMKALLFGATPTDTLTLGISCALILALAALACLFPAFRASRVDPAIALRSET